jgi:hypothetical protein
VLYCDGDGIQEKIFLHAILYICFLVAFKFCNFMMISKLETVHGHSSFLLWGLLKIFECRN